jgi:aminoglycoside phosphotransferase (APT) family kinase protein
MVIQRMHVDEIMTDVELIRRLMAAQFSKWAELEITPVLSSGTDNAMYRLGDDMVVRMPRRPGMEDVVEREQRWLPLLASHLPVAIPVPLGMGQPGEGYPYHWSIYRWLEGVNPVVGEIADPYRLARELAGVIRAMQRVEVRDAPPVGKTLAERDEQVRRDIEALRDEINADTVTTVWEKALTLPDYDGPPVWVHGDIAPGNLLLIDDRLSALIDFSGVGIGDPSIDMQVAWNLLPRKARATLKEALEVDDTTWHRARARALAQALVQIPYYKETNIPLATNARHVIREVLTEAREDG